MGKCRNSRRKMRLVFYMSNNNAGTLTTRIREEKRETGRQR